LTLLKTLIIFSKLIYIFKEFEGWADLHAPNAKLLAEDSNAYACGDNCQDKAGFPGNFLVDLLTYSTNEKVNVSIFNHVKWEAYVLHYTNNDTRLCFILSCHLILHLCLNNIYGFRDEGQCVKFKSDGGTYKIEDKACDETQKFFCYFDCSKLRGFDI
jgi:hypothetical protein